MALELLCTGCQQELPPGFGVCMSCVPAQPILKDGSDLAGTADSYKIVKVLSQKGGTAITYLATSTKFGDVVVKELLTDPDPDNDKDNKIRFEDEFRILKDITSPGLPKAYDRFDVDGHRFLVEEFIAGQDLHDAVTKNGPLSARTVLEELGIQLLDVLDLLHTRTDANGTSDPWIHRDIKPENIIRRTNGVPVLIDLGSSKPLKRARSSGKKTTLVPQTEGYASWNLRQGNGNETDDLFALAYTLMFAYTGVEPQPGGANRDRLLQLLPALWRTTFANATEDVLVGTNPGDMSKRPKSAKEFQSQLRSLAQGVNPIPQTQTAPPQPRPVQPQPVRPPRPVNPGPNPTPAPPPAPPVQPAPAPAPPLPAPTPRPVQPQPVRPPRPVSPAPPQSVPGPSATPNAVGNWTSMLQSMGGLISIMAAILLALGILWVLNKLGWLIPALLLGGAVVAALVLWRRYGRSQSTQLQQKLKDWWRSLTNFRQTVAFSFIRVPIAGIICVIILVYGITFGRPYFAGTSFLFFPHLALGWKGFRGFITWMWTLLYGSIFFVIWLAHQQGRF